MDRRNALRATRRSANATSMKPPDARPRTAAGRFHVRHPGWRIPAGARRAAVSGDCCRLPESSGQRPSRDEHMTTRPHMCGLPLPVSASRHRSVTEVTESRPRDRRGGSGRSTLAMRWARTRRVPRRLAVTIAARGAADRRAHRTDAASDAPERRRATREVRRRRRWSVVGRSSGRRSRPRNVLQSLRSFAQLDLCDAKWRPPAATVFQLALGWSRTPSQRWRACLFVGRPRVLPGCCFKKRLVLYAFVHGVVAMALQSGVGGAYRPAPRARRCRPGGWNRPGIFLRGGVDS